MGVEEILHIEFIRRINEIHFMSKEKEKDRMNIVKIAVRQNLLLWQISKSLRDIDREIKKTQFKSI